eukprot:jgi/Mesen1/4980/ME000248S04260
MLEWKPIIYADVAAAYASGLTVRLGVQREGAYVSSNCINSHTRLSLVQISVVVQANEAAEAAKLTWAPGAAQALSSLLEVVVSRLELGSADISARRGLILRIKNLVHVTEPGTDVACFGSFEKGLSLPGSDLDLSLDLSCHSIRKFRNGEETQEDKVGILRRLLRLLYSMAREGQISKLSPVLRASVPVVSFVECGTGVSCDVTVSNYDGMFRSRVLRMIMPLAPHFRPLCLLVKAWARWQDVNASTRGTLNSVSWTRSPPLLPPFSEIVGPDAEIGGLSNLRRMVDVNARLQECQARMDALAARWQPASTASLGELLASFFTQMAAVEEESWERGLCASTYRGCWTTKEWTTHAYSSAMGVEDFIDTSMNCARACQKHGRAQIYAALRQAAVSVRDAARVGTKNAADACDVQLFGRLVSRGKRALRGDEAAPAPAPKSSQRQVAAGTRLIVGAGTGSLLSSSSPRKVLPTAPVVLSRPPLLPAPVQDPPILPGYSKTAPPNGAPSLPPPLANPYSMQSQSIPPPMQQLPVYHTPPGNYGYEAPYSGQVNHNVGYGQGSDHYTSSQPTMSHYNQSVNSWPPQSGQYSQGYVPSYSMGTRPTYNQQPSDVTGYYNSQTWSPYGGPNQYNRY